MKKFQYILFLSLCLVSGLLYSESNTWDQITTREFRGKFPNDEEREVRILLNIEESKFSGIMQYEGQFETIDIAGILSDSTTVRINILNNQGEETGSTIVGKIRGDQLLGKYLSMENEFEFIFQEIDINNPPEFGTRKKSKVSSFIKFVNKFDELTLPTEVKFSPNAIEMTDAILLMDKKVEKIGTYDPAITLNIRLKVLKKLYFGGKLLFDDIATGIIVHAYYEAFMDGNLYATYLYLFDKNENFTQAIVLFEAQKLDNPSMTCKISRSKLFSITQLDQEHTYRLNEQGFIELLDRE